MAVVEMQDQDTKDRFSTISSVFSRAWGSTPYVETQKRSNLSKEGRRAFGDGTANVDETIGNKANADALSASTVTNSISWCDSNGVTYHLNVSRDVYDRLIRDCKTSDLTWLHNFVRNKWEGLGNMRYPYMISPDFYLLWKEICGVTYELFADSMNASGVLDHFCSSDTIDKRFGACGSWKDVEETVDGGAGHLPFDNEFLKHLLIRMETNVRKNRAYCRVLVLPYNENGVLRRLLDSQNSEFEGEVLAVIDGGLLRFRHQEELFECSSGLNRFTPSGNRFRKCKSVYQPARPRKRQQPEQDVSHEDASSKWVAGHDARDSDRVCESPFAIVIWMNENYRHKYPAPSDVEDVLLHWAVSNFGSAACSALDIDAIDRAFHDRTSSGERKADIFAV